ncbi:unnamed protein product [Calypogeia fissa]
MGPQRQRATVTRSHLEAANIPARISRKATPATEAAPRAKQGCPLGSRDSHPRLPRTVLPSPPVIPATVSPLSGHADNEEITINYMHTRKTLQRDKMQVDDNFAFHISEEITNDTPDPLRLLRPNLDQTGRNGS